MLKKLKNIAKNLIKNKSDDDINKDRKSVYFKLFKKYNIPELIDLTDIDINNNFMKNLWLKYDKYKKDFLEENFNDLSYIPSLDELELEGFDINYFLTLDVKIKKYLSDKESILLVNKEGKKYLGLFYPRVDVDIDFDEIFIFGSNIFNYFFGKGKDLSFMNSDKDFTMEELMQYMETNNINDIGIDPINQSQYIITAEINKKNVLLTDRPVVKDLINDVFNKIKTSTSIDTTTEFPTTTGLLKLGLINTNGVRINRTFRINFIKVKMGYTASIRRFMNYEEIRDFGLKGLSYTDTAIKLINEAIDQKGGISMILGETNSGKSTLLAAILNKIYISQQKIISIENPIEIEMPYLQIDLTETETADEKFKMTKELAQSAILRHNPNVVLMSEIRTKDEIEFFAGLGLRGHMALATLHAGSVENAIEILLKVSDENELKSILNLFVHQELLAKKCLKCNGTGMIHENKCIDCKGSGSKGVVPIYEIVKFGKLGQNDSLRDFKKLLSDGKVQILSKKVLVQQYWEKDLLFEEDYLRLTKD